MERGHLNSDSDLRGNSTRADRYPPYDHPFGRMSRRVGALPHGLREPPPCGGVRAPHQAISVREVDRLHAEAVGGGEEDQLYAAPVSCEVGFEAVQVIAEGGPEGGEGPVGPGAVCLVSFVFVADVERVFGSRQCRLIILFATGTVTDETAGTISSAGCTAEGAGTS